MNHSEYCKSRVKARAEYIELWPNACTHCNATGVVYDPGVYRYADGSGEPPSTEPCDHCSGREHKSALDDNDFCCCPRCAGAINVTGDGLKCDGCGFDSSNDSHFMPEHDCWCWENADFGSD